MRKITIFFSRPKEFKLFSWAIRKIEKTEFSHTGLMFHSDAFDRDLVYHASSLQVNFMSGIIFEDHNIIVNKFELDIPDDEFKKVMQYCIDQSGKPYSLKGVLTVGITKLFHKDVVLKDGESSIYCSELIARMLAKALSFVIEQDLDSITPKDLNNYLITNYKSSQVL